MSLKKLRIMLLIVVSALTLVGCANKKDNYKGLSACDIYTQGQRSMAKSSYAQAIKDFEALEARYPYSEYSQDAYLALAEAYYKKGDYELALTTLNRFIRMYPQHDRVDYAYYLKGQVSYDQNLTFMYRYLPIDRSLRDPTPAYEAYATFRDLKDLFPNSQYAEAACARMIFLRNQLANHELHIMNYYMKREAYLAAVNRANYILNNYEDTPAVSKAQCALALAYERLGIVEQGQEVCTPPAGKQAKK